MSFSFQTISICILLCLAHNIVLGEKCSLKVYRLAMAIHDKSNRPDHNIVTHDTPSDALLTVK